MIPLIHDTNMQRKKNHDTNIESMKALYFFIYLFYFIWYL